MVCDQAGAAKATLLVGRNMAEISFAALCSVRPVS